MDLNIHVGDCRAFLKTLPDETVNCCVTSPPYYGLRDNLHPDQIGMEETEERYISHQIEVFNQVRRVLRKDGTLWLNMGDSYSEDKSLKGMPWKIAFALKENGWILRQDIIWHKLNPMPESVTDRCVKSHEYLFLFSKAKKYYFDHLAIRELSKGRASGNNARKDSKLRSVHFRPNSQASSIPWQPTERRNKRSVWSLPVKPYKGLHFATFPPDLIEPCILAGCLPNGVVLDPFAGAGTTGGVALKHGRKAILCEVNPHYASLIPSRIDEICAN